MCVCVCVCVCVYVCVFVCVCARARACVYVIPDQALDVQNVSGERVDVVITQPQRVQRLSAGAEGQLLAEQCGA